MSRHILSNIFMASNEHQNFLIRFLKFVTYPLHNVVKKIISEIHYLEMFFIRLYNIYAFISQMLFFTSCALCCNEYRDNERYEEFLLIGLKTLLFYSVFTYFATKTKEILSSDRATMFQNWNIMEGLCRIAIEWAKAIIIVVCLREQGIYFKPGMFYAFLTFTYYLCTEKIFTEISQKIIQYFALEIFEELEHLYVPLVLKIYSLVLSTFLGLYSILTERNMTFEIAFFYFTIYLKLKDSYYNQWKIIESEKQIFANFRFANLKELQDYDDICAVCLNKMSKAKITPCNHFFHPNCLKQCLKNSLMCPICKFEF